MKKVLLVFLVMITLFAGTSCAKKEETAKEELYTVIIKNESGVEVFDVGFKQKERQRRIDR